MTAQLRLPRLTSTQLDTLSLVPQPPSPPATPRASAQQQFSAPAVLTTLFDALEAAGWQPRGDALVAPSGALRLPHGPFCLHTLRNESAARRERLLRNRHAFYSSRDFVANLTDLETLLGALEQLSDDGGLERFFGPLHAPLERLARHRQLTLLRYVEARPEWQLTGPHLDRGLVRVVVSKADRERVAVSGQWLAAGAHPALAHERTDTLLLPRDGQLVLGAVIAVLDDLGAAEPESHAA